MIIFNRKNILQRKLKNRFFKFNKIPHLRYGTLGLYCLHTFRFEFRYCLFLRKFFKRLFRKNKRKITTFSRRKVWLFIRPNYVLTHKSKNARMGKGKGNFKRWCTIIHPGCVFIEHLNLSPRVYKKYLHRINLKLKIQLKFLYYGNQLLKKKTINNGFCPNSEILDIYKVRNTLYKNVYSIV